MLFSRPRTNDIEMILVEASSVRVTGMTQVPDPVVLGLSRSPPTQMFYRADGEAGEASAWGGNRKEMIPSVYDATVTLGI